MSASRDCEDGAFETVPNLAQLAKSHAELQALYHTAPVGLAFIDTQLRYVRINDQLAAINGKPVEAHIGRSIREMVPEVAPKIESILRQVIATGQPVYHCEVTGTTAADLDTEQTWLASYAPVLLPDGSTVGVNTVVWEITKLKLAMEELYKYQQIVSATPDLISFVDTDYTYQVVNDGYLKAHGRRPEELVGRPIAEILGEKPFQEIVKPKLDSCLGGKSIRYQGWFDYAAAGRRYMDVCYNPAVDSEGRTRGVAVSVRDVTDLKRVEDQLRESRRRFDTICNTIQDVVWITDPRSSIVLFASPAYEKIWGRTLQSLYDNGRDWIDAIHPEDSVRVKEALEQIKDGRPLDQEYRIIRPDGSLRWIRDRGYPIWDVDGVARQIAGIAQDITEQKHADELKANVEAALYHAQKMQAVGQLAAGLAHDINTLLTIILGNAELIESSSKKPGQTGSAQAGESLLNIKQAVDRGKHLIDQLVALGRAHPQASYPLNVNEVVEEAVELVKPHVGQSIRMTVRCAEGLPDCKVDRQQLSRAVVNLAMNACDAMPDGGTLGIATDVQTLTGRELPPVGGMGEGQYVVLRISDSGSGIDADTLDRIFEPFFSTKPVGQGMGLGLSVVHGIVERNKGYIRVESKPGEGTSFILYFPAVV
jgi:PAS domain S-box-containing protein